MRMMKNINDCIQEGFFQNVGADIKTHIWEPKNTKKFIKTYIPIDEVFRVIDWHGKELYVKPIENKTCGGCVFVMGCAEHDGCPACAPNTRKDKKSVIFVKEKI